MTNAETVIYCEAIKQAKISPYNTMYLQMTMAMCGLYEGLRAEGKEPNREWMKEIFKKHGVKL